MFSVSLVIGFSHTNRASAGEAEDSRGMGLFHDYVEPLLKQNCYECHSHEAKKAKGGMVLDSRASILKGGDSGPVLVPGEPENSLMIEAILYGNEDLQMPPDYQLEQDDIARLREWISLGAPDPREGPAFTGFGQETEPPKAENLWSVQPLGHAEVPEPDLSEWETQRLESWPKNDIDRFLLAGLAEAKLSPSKDADASKLIRRIHDTLTGLPPLPEATAAFLEAAGQDIESALVEKIDELLDSPHFGERWGRHWLDLARYADVTGSDQPRTYFEAWRYRNYVIDAFNSDKPYDRFVREQLSGDLLDWEEPEERAANLIATGFLGLAHIIGATRDKEQVKLDTIDEHLELIGKTFLGVQIGCARCHDHKIDPFPTRDYYALAGIFRSTEMGMSMWRIQLPTGSLPEVSPEAPAWMRVDDEEVQIHGVVDAAEIRDEPIHVRGEPYLTKEIVRRSFPTLVTMEGMPGMPEDRSGRLALANWILSEENPLSARVIVNRIWEHVFGLGIVRTADNFGFTGDPPSNPELLDYLARRFREKHRYSFKSLIRELMLSRVWRQSSAARPECMQVDPDNRLIWRFNPKRKDAESIIDSIQFVTGQLNLEPGRSTAPKVEAGNKDSTAGLKIANETLKLRAVYWPVFRKDMPVDMDILPLFDFPIPTSSQGTRPVTNVPSQSLALLNNPVVLDASRMLGRKLEADAPTESERLDAAFMTVLARKPSTRERDRMLSFLNEFEEEVKKTGLPRPDQARSIAWNRLCHTLLVSNEFTVVE